MTAYNEEDRLEACLQHILNQSIKPIGIFVVDDGSTDKTGEILDKYPVQSIKINEPKYNVSSFNPGIYCIKIYNDEFISINKFVVK